MRSTAVLLLVIAWNFYTRSVCSYIVIYKKKVLLLLLLFFFSSKNKKAECTLDLEIKLKYFAKLS